MMDTGVLPSLLRANHLTLNSLDKPALARAAMLWFFLFFAAPVSLAQVADSSQVDDIRLGLALSGGGAKGFAHIGVLKVLEEEGIEADVIAGTSMGAIVGGLYAAGYSTAFLEEFVLAQDWTALFEDRPQREMLGLDERQEQEAYPIALQVRDGRLGLPAGLVSGHRITMLLTRLFADLHEVQNFDSLEIPFACVATDLSTGKAHRFESGYLPRILRASMSVPSALNPVSIDGSIYIDGSVTRNLPVEDALAIGATHVLGVDVGSPLLPADSLDSFIDVMDQVSSFQKGQSTIEQRALSNVLVIPDLEGYSAISFQNAKELIALGEEAMRRSLPELRSLLDATGKQRAEDHFQLARTPIDSLLISGIQINGLRGIYIRQFIQDLGIQAPVKLSFDQLERALNRAYYAGPFQNLNYQLVDLPDREGRHLLIQVQEAHSEKAYIGLRYQSHFGPSLRFSTRFRDRLGVGSRLDLALRLGENLQLASTYHIPLKINPIRLQTGLVLNREPIDLFEENVRLASLNIRTLKAFTLLSLEGLGQSQTLIGARLELFDLGRNVGIFESLDRSQELLLFSVDYQLDTFDQLDFATRGHKIRGSIDVSTGWLGSNRFSHAFIDWEWRKPLSEHFSLMLRGVTGSAANGNIPVQYRFYGGGGRAYRNLINRQIPLLGYRFYEKSGNSVNAAYAGLQYRLSTNIYSQLIWNMAYFSEEWDPAHPVSDYEWGVGLVGGILTPIGPLDLTLALQTIQGPYTLSLNIGHIF